MNIKIGKKSIMTKFIVFDDDDIGLSKSLKAEYPLYGAVIQRDEKIYIEWDNISSRTISKYNEQDQQRLENNIISKIKEEENNVDQN